MIYLLTTAILLMTIAACFLLGRGGLADFGWKQWTLRVLVALPLLASGVAHFTRTPMFASIVPPFLPFRSQLVLVSGAMELAGAIGLFLPAFVRAASTCLVFLMVAIFPANVYVANQTIAGLHMPSVPVRTAMQVIYIVLLVIAGWGYPHQTADPSAPLRSGRDDKGRGVAD